MCSFVRACLYVRVNVIMKSCVCGYLCVRLCASACMNVYVL